MSRFGFKQIDASNWQEPDPMMRAFVRIDPEYGPTDMEAKDWVEAILTPSLLETVPEDVRALFEVARGAMVYGFFFYPLFTLAAEQLFRVSEAAISHKCRSMQAKRSIKSFASRIEWLIEQGAIPSAQLPRWHATKELRNLASHPERQSIMAPGNAIGIMETTASLINSLFGGA
jgi:hypothetical protein